MYDVLLLWERVELEISLKLHFIEEGPILHCIR